jgi:hypothetical protein
MRSDARLPAGAAFVLLLVAAAAGGCSGQSAQAGPEPVAPAPRSPAREELNALIGALDGLLGDAERVPSESPLAAGLRQARADVVWLERRAATWPPSPAVDAFVAAITSHRQVLADVRQAPAAEAGPVLEGVVRDLAVKARQCRTFGGPVPVDVRVVTRDASNNVVNGYEVWYVRKAYENKPAAFRRFDQNSSPAGHIFLEAGYYVLWADHLSARARRQRAVPLDIEIGNDRREQVVDLVVPDAAAEASSVGAP